MGFGERLSNAATRVSGTLDKAIDIEAQKERDAKAQAFEAEKQRVQELIDTRLAGVRYEHDTELEGTRASNQQKLQEQQDTAAADRARDEQTFKKEFEYPHELEKTDRAGANSLAVAQTYAGVRSGATTGAMSKPQQKAIEEALKVYDNMTKDVDPAIDGEGAKSAAEQAAFQRAYALSGGDEAVMRALGQAMNIPESKMNARLQTFVAAMGTKAQPQQTGAQQAGAEAPPPTEAPAAAPKEQGVDPVDNDGDGKISVEEVVRAKNAAKNGTPNVKMETGKGGSAGAQGGGSGGAASTVDQKRADSMSENQRLSAAKRAKADKVAAEQKKFMANQLARANEERRKKGMPPITQLPEAELRQLQERFNAQYADALR